MTAADRLAEIRERREAIAADASTRRQVEWLVSWVRDEPYLIHELLAEVDRRQAALDAVLEGHRPHTVDGTTYCLACLYCNDDDDAWPCPTVRAITSALEVDHG